MSNFEVKCCYCDCEFSLVENGSYPQELFDDGGEVERECPNDDCKKKLFIKIEARWHYKADSYESDNLNEEKRDERKMCNM